MFSSLLLIRYWKHSENWNSTVDRMCNQEQPTNIICYFCPIRHSSPRYVHKTKTFRMMLVVYLHNLCHFLIRTLLLFFFSCVSEALHKTPIDRFTCVISVRVLCCLPFEKFFFTWFPCVWRLILLVLPFRLTPCSWHHKTTVSINRCHCQQFS